MAVDPDVSKELGSAATWFLGLCVSAIVALATAVGLQWKYANKVYGYRLAERDTLKDALNNSANAQRDATKAQEEQNRVTEELADAVRTMAGAFDRLSERLKEQEGDGKEHRRDLVTVLNANSEGVRVLTGAVYSIRDRLKLDGAI